MRHYRFPHPIDLYNLGDIHRGDDACDVSLFLRLRDRIHASPHARWVSTGDMLNVATKSSKSSPYESASVQTELDALVAELSPIADKCLGFVGSNHPARIRRETGLCLDSVLAGMLNVPFLGELGTLAVSCGRMTHWIAMHHTTGGGATDGAKANKQTRLMNLMPCMDVYLAGHTHTFMAATESQFAPDRKRGKVVMLKQIKVTTGHFLDYENSYAASLMLSPKPKGASVVHLEHSGNGVNEQKQYRAHLED